MTYLQERARGGRDRDRPALCRSRAARLHDHLNTVDKPLNELGNAELVPGTAALDKLNASLR